MKLLQGFRFIFNDLRSYLHTGGKKIVTPAPRSILRNPPEGMKIGFSTLIQPDGDVIVRGPQPDVFINADDWERYLIKHRKKVSGFMQGLSQSVNAVMSTFAVIAGALYSLAVYIYQYTEFSSNNVPTYFHFIYFASLAATFIVPGYRDWVKGTIMQLLFKILTLVAKSRARKYIDKQLKSLQEG